MARQEYSEDLYHDAIVAVVGDIVYSNASCDSKIGRIRKLTEYIVRRLTKCDPRDSLELGSPSTRLALKRAGVNESFFWDAYEIIRKSGNKASHSTAE